MQHPLAVALLVVELALVHIFLAAGKHEVDHSGEFVCGDGLAFVHAGAQSAVAVVGAQGRSTRTQRGGGQLERLGGAVGAALAGFAEHVGAAGLGARTQAKPGAEVLDGLKARHVHTDLADDRHGGADLGCLRKGSSPTGQDHGAALARQGRGSSRHAPGIQGTGLRCKIQLAINWQICQTQDQEGR